MVKVDMNVRDQGLLGREGKTYNDERVFNLSIEVAAFSQLICN